MKTHGGCSFLLRHVVAGLVLLIASEVSAVTVGRLEAIDRFGVVSGWSFESSTPNTSNSVHVSIDGVLVVTIAASQPRADVDSVYRIQGNHGFSTPVPAQYFDGVAHSLAVSGLDGIALRASPMVFTLAPLPTLGDATISANGITLRTAARLAGAIGSLRWNGKEFLNSSDHGREMQTAWQGNGRGECFNPTEAGSDADGTGPGTTSQLLAIATTPVSVTTVTHPAFWLTPGESSFCNFDASYPGFWHVGTAVNTTAVSASTLQKTATIGYAGLANVIEYMSAITLASAELAQEPLQYLMLKNPTAYLSTDFTAVYRFDPHTNALTPLGPIVPSFSAYGSTPLIAATVDGAYALAVYTDEIPGGGFPQNEQHAVSGYQFVDWGSVVSLGTRIPKTPPVGSVFVAGTYRYRTFVIVGTLQDVMASMRSLAVLYPGPC